ncbi:hypothetical protein GCM10028832_03170 [Streptomyces sparsus]
MILEGDEQLRTVSEKHPCVPLRACHTPLCRPGTPLGSPVDRVASVAFRPQRMLFAPVVSGQVRPIVL